MVAGPLFVITFLVEGAKRPGYDPMRHPISSLAFGRSGWIQRANFLVTGFLMLAFALGLRRALRPPGGSTWGPLLIGTYAVGLIGAGVFVADPVNGYPPGTPYEHASYSTHGALHEAFSSLVFLGVPAACFAFRRFTARGERGWASYSAATGLAFVGAFVLSNAGLAQVKGLAKVAGLFQRVALVVGFGWLSLLAVRCLRSLREG